MATHPSRYPGAQSFADDAFARSVFFGRERESVALTHQILANRLVTVYAKSGIGKTSLLQAGIAQRLRDEGLLPLFVRVNDTSAGPVAGVIEGIRGAATQQAVEYHPGRDLSLWHFFKTAEFWRGDQLLVPVLVLDQFEELFTLQAVASRTLLLRQLGYLVRGVRPPPESLPDTSPEPPLSDTAPAIRLVISLREDYLGLLEEASEHIPQILDQRFRLTPLSREAATAAIEGPAGIRNDGLSTRPFVFRQGTVDAILNHLTERATGAAGPAGAHVEPFHLQLICQRIEALVSERQRGADTAVEISLDDLGGERGLRAMLRDFYASVIGRIERRRTRRRVRMLCEQYLINSEGRRLSLDQSEIVRVLKITPAVLGELVEQRLLRSDQRADSRYFELSHDSLVAPILATRRAQGLALGWLGVVSSIALVVAGLFFALLVLIWILPDPHRDYAAAAMAISIVFVLFFFGVRIWSRSLLTLKRFSTGHGRKWRW